jgi:transposase
MSPTAPLQSPSGQARQRVVLGVDTHRDQNTAAVVAIDGRLCGNREFATTAQGCHDLLAWSKALGEITRAGVECTGSYGVSLSRLLQSQGIEVLEVNQPDKRARRTAGKTDAVDAEAAARAVLSGRATAVAKTADGPVEALRVLKMMRDSAVHARTKAINQLNATLVTAAAALRETLSGLGAKTLVRRCSTLVDSAQDSVTQRATVYVLRGLGQRILALTAEADQTEKHMNGLLQQHAPKLIARTGIGPDSAAALLIVAGDNHDRIRTEASFAALCGVSPVEASSGNTQRRRLNRGGDRRANAALYRIVLSRLRWDPRTQTYMTRRLAEGRTRREIVRCLKRYVAREVFALIVSSTLPAVSVTHPHAA